MVGYIAQSIPSIIGPMDWYNEYSFILDALSLNTSGFCNIEVYTAIHPGEEVGIWMMFS